jgi:hypothetical protein
VKSRLVAQSLHRRLVGAVSVQARLVLLLRFFRECRDERLDLADLCGLVEVLRSLEKVRDC